MAEAKSLQSPT